MAPPEPSVLRRTVRAHWEVAAAAGILLGVLTIIDLFAIGDPRLLLSLAPLVGLLAAALFRLTPACVAAWVVGFAAVGLASGEARYAGLAYPAAAAALLLFLQRRRGDDP
jgi:hypothetical protein